jgi:hypothetical protein
MDRPLHKEVPANIHGVKTHWSKWTGIGLIKIMMANQFKGAVSYLDWETFESAMISDN